MLLGIIAKPLRRDKFEVTPDSVAYLTALVTVSEEVRLRCHLKYALSRWQTDLTATVLKDGFLNSEKIVISYHIFHTLNNVHYRALVLFFSFPFKAVGYSDYSTAKTL